MRGELITADLWWKRRRHNAAQIGLRTDPAFLSNVYSIYIFYIII